MNSDPSSLRQVMLGSGWPVAWQVRVTLDPSRATTPSVVPLSTMFGGTVEKTTSPRWLNHNDVMVNVICYVAGFLTQDLQIALAVLHRVRVDLLGQRDTQSKQRWRYKSRWNVVPGCLARSYSLVMRVNPICWAVARPWDTHLPDTCRSRDPPARRCVAEGTSDACCSERGSRADYAIWPNGPNKVWCNDLRAGLSWCLSRCTLVWMVRMVCVSTRTQATCSGGKWRN